MTSAYAAMAMRKRDLTKASEMLLGLVTGIIADQQLHDMEIKLLSTWLSSTADIHTVWPGSVLAQKVNEILADGIITDAEREHLMGVLQQFAITDFASTGSASPEVLQLPINDAAHVDLTHATVCLTGEFIYGTRDVCQRRTAEAGAELLDTVTRKVRYLVVGTNVSTHWANTSYGRKIQKAVDLQAAGLPVAIISERRWLAALGISAAS